MTFLDIIDFSWTDSFIREQNGFQTVKWTIKGRQQTTWGSAVWTADRKKKERATRCPLRRENKATHQWRDDRVCLISSWLTFELISKVRCWFPWSKKKKYSNLAFDSLAAASPLVPCFPTCHRRFEQPQRLFSPFLQQFIPQEAFAGNNRHFRWLKALLKLSIVKDFDVQLSAQT